METQQNNILISKSIISIWFGLIAVRYDGKTCLLQQPTPQQIDERVGCFELQIVKYALVNGRYDLRRG